MNITKEDMLRYLFEKQQRISKKFEEENEELYNKYVRETTTTDLDTFNELLRGFSVERKNKIIDWVNSKLHKEPSKLTDNEMNLVFIAMQDRINKGDK